MTTVAAPQTTIPRDVVVDRGTWAMLLFIATEATLFVCLFFSYYYLGHDKPIWPPEPPKWKLAVVMLAVLFTSSGVLHWGERQDRSGRPGAARGAVGATVALGLLFLGVQALEFRNHLQDLQPTTSAYGSIFYTITSIHAAHLILGLLMLIYVLLLPDIGPAARPPHRPLHNASLYWHFVDVVWLVIVGLLYAAPNLAR
ncbi:MAG TPA: heme-copper oxidase subunit III [Vicinamibacterales bacterium]|nr:heme-copper oxidase subunit III [Vicinamibacterales bacterium]